MIRKFVSIAEKYPDDSAVVFHDANEWQSIDYKTLLLSAKAVAARLYHEGVRAGDAVVLPSERGPELCANLLGILWLGAHYVFIDPAYPQERQDFIFKTSGASAGLFEGNQNRLSRLAANWLQTPVASGQFETPDYIEDASLPGFLCFTSGSTGVPKGVLVPQAGMMRLVVDTDYIDFNRPRFLQASALSFDAASLEIWGSLLNGGVCVLHFEDKIPSIKGLEKSLVDQSIDSLWLTVSLFNLVITEKPEVLQGIKQLLVGGEAQSVSHICLALEKLPETRIYNGYGPTENTTFTTIYQIPQDFNASNKRVPIGFPIKGTECGVFDENLKQVEGGDVGELITFGDGLAIKYLNQPDITNERFIEVEFKDGLLKRGYRTGDLVMKDSDGCYHYWGRNDKQVKIDGNRIEPEEIEQSLLDIQGIEKARVLLKVGPKGQKRLAAYIVGSGDSESIRKILGATLPKYMVPHFIIFIEEMPLNQNGKLDEANLPDPYENEADVGEGSNVANEKIDVGQVRKSWVEILDRANISSAASFFDVGGTSIEALKLTYQLEAKFKLDLNATFVFEYPTIASQENYFNQLKSRVSGEADKIKSISNEKSSDIAVVGMACRVPGASDVDVFWQNLLECKESITFFSSEELDSSIPDNEKKSSRYVPAKGVVEGADLFDAGFFDISPREADILDPQQRIMLELTWHALEDAGYAPDGMPLNAGLYMGSDWPRYYRTNIVTNSSLLNSYGDFNASLANEQDFLTTRISYKLNLTGPSVNVATACSTGLVAITNAVTALQRNECELAVAGGVSISTPLNAGYAYQEGGMLSADGHTRTFDADATGTTFNDGAGLVVLKRLSDAERDGDYIYGVIKGCAVNNDGAVKASFTAPSVVGQVDVYNAAIREAGIKPSNVGFIEAHGTATPLGDPIEVESLQRVYDNEIDGENKEQGEPASIPCALGSVKSNIGHTIHAAGVVGFIKAIKAVESGKIPGTLHYKRPNANIQLDKSRFYVNAETVDWSSEKHRLAAISSLGVGGTNAHVIVQEYKQSDQQEQLKKQLYAKELPVLISAKSESALKLQIDNYREWFKTHSASSLFESFSYTNSCHKAHFQYRAALSASSFESAIPRLAEIKLASDLFASNDKLKRVGFLFTGQGSQRVNMGADLYAKNKAFKDVIDQGINQLEQLAVQDNELKYLSWFRAVLFSSDKNLNVNEYNINQTRYSQPALFLFEYALAKYTMESGCSPEFYIGHSIGEWVAAALTGVYSFEDALSLVAYRGYLMQSMKPGSMLSIQCDERKLEQYCQEGLNIAAYNAPGVYVLSGEDEIINSIVSLLENEGIAHRLLVTSHAFHSSMMEPMVERFQAKIDQVTMGDPDLTSCFIVSTVTGEVLQKEQVLSSAYWANQVREPVRFSQALQYISERYSDELVACIEIGPGESLVKLLGRHAFARGKGAYVVGLATQPGGGESGAGEREVVSALTSLWCRGFDINWEQFFGSNQYNKALKKTKLPRYRFVGERHWIDVPVESEQRQSSLTNLQENLNIYQQTTSKIVEEPMSAEQHLVEVQNKIRAILEDVSGYDLSDMEPGMHFNEAGLDSLLLTQAALAIEKQYGGNVTFRMLAEVYTDLASVSEYMAEFIPVEVVSVEQTVTQPASNGDPAHVSNGGNASAMNAIQMPSLHTGVSVQNSEMAALVQSQLQIMQMQLQALSGVTAMPQTTSPQPEAESPQVQSNAQQPVKNKEGVKNDDKPLSAVTKNAMRMTRISREIIGTNLTSAQQKWLDEVMNRFQTRFAASKEVTQKHREYFSDPRSVSGFNPAWKEIVFPMVIERSKGSRIWDISGNEFIDVANGFGPILFGHRPDFIMDAVKEQFESGIETGPQHPLAGEVAQLVCEITKNERCAYANTGSEAMACALRMVRTATGKDTVIMFEGSYHGIFDEMVARPGKDHQGMPLAPGIPRAALTNVRVLPWGDPESIDIIRSMKDVAAVIVETVQSRNPVIQDADYIKQIREASDEIEAALIFDEVVTGFRVAPGGIQERFGVKADMVTYGKILGGGFPIGLVAGKAKYLDALDGGYWEFGDDSIPEAGVTFFAGTFLRHPAALAAAKQVLLRIKKEGIQMYQEMDAKTERLSTEVNAVIKRLECDITLDHFSSFFYVKVPANAHWGHMLYKLMLLEGVHIIQNAGSFLTTEHSSEDIDKIIAAFTKSIALLVSNGLIEGNRVESNIMLSEKAVIPEGARLGKNAQGEPAYFIEDESKPGKYIEVGKP